MRPMLARYTHAAVPFVSGCLLTAVSSEEAGQGALQLGHPWLDPAGL